MDKTLEGKLEIEVGFDDVKAGHNEDGEEVIAPLFFISATYPSGRRFVLNHTWGPVANANNVDTIQAEVVAFSKRIIKAQDAGIWKGPKFEWSEIQPAYGSEAYAANWREYAAADDKADGINREVA